MNWWHTIELPNGEVTPGRVDYRGQAGDCFLLPKDLTDKRVLDFGTYDGYWAIEAKKRGAKFVIASDRWDPPLETAQYALKAYDIRYICSGDLDFPIAQVGCGDFDIVLFYGIVYHLKNPVMGLWNAARMCKPGGLVIIESAVNQGKMEGMTNDVPLLWLIDEVHHDDPSNYVMPNGAGLLQLCRMAGLNPIQTSDNHPNIHSRFTVMCERK